MLHLRLGVASFIKTSTATTWQTVSIWIQFVIYKILETENFSNWLTNLKDIQGKVSILRRIKRLHVGNFGDFKYLENSIYELRIKTGPGYRVYYTKKDEKIILLLIGGDKSTQQKDIKKAKTILKEYSNEW